MKHYTEYNWYQLEKLTIKKNGEFYDNNIYTFDTECTSIYKIDGKWVSNNMSISNYDGLSRYGIMYIWQFSINKDVLYGRTYEELEKFLELLNTHIPTIKIVYSHNLAYEFNLLRNIIDDFEVFARKPLKPIYAMTKTYNIEFRCSYFLTNGSLKNLSSQYNIETKKGEMDYDVIRLPSTALTQEELEYCENDCKVLYEVIKIYKNNYINVANIPLTQTGIVRKDIKSELYSKTFYQKYVKKTYPKNYSDLLMQTTAFMGGQTHANWKYVNNVIQNVDSWDIGSSYPACILLYKYPRSYFTDMNVNKFTECEDNKHYLFDVTFHNIQSKMHNVYLPSHKNINGKNVLIENGKILKADRVRYVLCEIDYKIVISSYDIERIEYHKIQSSYSEYIRTPNLLNYTADMYEKKTSLKGDKEKYFEYCRSKEKINSIYGMCVTNIYKDDVLFDNENGWCVDRLTKDKITEKIHENLEARLKIFLPFIWGVYITAYARRNLWNTIQYLDSDVIYYDTDSVKIVNGKSKRTQQYFKDYNANIYELITKSCSENNIDINKLIPKNKNGIECPIGFFEYENDNKNGEYSYNEFKTLGAKKYAYTTNRYTIKDRLLNKPNLSITIAGVHKEKGKKALKHNVDNLRKGLIFGYEHSGKMTIRYEENQGHIEINGETIEQKYGNVAMYTAYSLDMTKEYLNIIMDKTNMAQHNLLKVRKKDDYDNMKKNTVRNKNHGKETNTL